MHPTLTTDELRAIADETHRWKRKLAVHAMTKDGIVNAVEAGADSIEHGTRADKEALAKMKARGVTLVPTTWAQLGWKREGPKGNREGWEKRRALLGELVKTAREAGVAIASGSDATSPETHGNNAEEIVLLGELGLPPIEALRAATTNAAALIGAQDAGAIEAGKSADLIAVEGDPLADLSALHKVRFVMKAGAVVRDSMRPSP
jgi:imidazolonepropionase-like amidohydrolase